MLSVDPGSAGSRALVGVKRLWLLVVRRSCGTLVICIHIGKCRVNILDLSERATKWACLRYTGGVSGYDG